MELGSSNQDQPTTINIGHDGPCDLATVRHVEKAHQPWEPHVDQAGEASIGTPERSHHQPVTNTIG